MLKSHLDPTTDAASRKPETIDAEVQWLVARLNLRASAPVLDLGCGPGLYCTRLARRGLAVTGIDFSPNSIRYARETAAQQGLPITYRLADYDRLEDRGLYQAAMLIEGDFCVLPDDRRDSLLDRLYQALRPGGFFAFDVMTLAAFAAEQPGRFWEVRESGFWRPTPYLPLETRFVYPEDHVSLHEYGVVDEQGNLTTYRVWSRYYCVETLTAVLERNGFTVEDTLADLTGKPYTSDSEWLGVVARRD
jgi:SAM-dependent methyltransferase